MQVMKRAYYWLTIVAALGLAPPVEGQTYLLELEKSDATKVMQVDEDGGFALFGAANVGVLPASGYGLRLMWWPARIAFRVGYVDGDEWDITNLGSYSVAMGRSTTASGSVSMAMGEGTEASSWASTALGFQTTASNDFSTALGTFTTAGGVSSTAMGRSTMAVGDSSTAMGGGTTASGGVSTAMGKSTTASGLVSTAMGYETEATGEYTASMGRGTTAQAQASLVLGRYNVIEGSTGTWVEDDPVLVVGNGADDANRSNALTLRKNGDLEVMGLLMLNSHEKDMLTAIPAQDRKYEEMSCDNGEIVLSAGWNMPNDVNVIRSRRKSQQPWVWEFAMSNSSTMGTSGTLYITCVGIELR